MSHPSQTTWTYNCPDCNFSPSSQGGLCWHRTKSHRANSSSVKSVTVVRSYPEGKKSICCLCGNTGLNYPNLKRHFQSVHPDTVLSATFHCLICNKVFPNAQAASVHCKRAHSVSKTDPTIPQSPTPIMSCIDTNPSATSDISSDTFMDLGSRRSNRHSRKNHPSTVNQSILSSSVSQLSPSSYEPTPDIPTLVSVNQSELHEKVHDPISLEDLLNQPESISSSLSRLISECDILPASLPQRSPQTVSLTSSPVSSTEISTSLLSAVNDSSRFTSPAPGPSPRRYQKDHTFHRRY